MRRCAPSDLAVCAVRAAVRDDALAQGQVPAPLHRLQADGVAHPTRGQHRAVLLARGIGTWVQDSISWHAPSFAPLQARSLGSHSPARSRERSHLFTSGPALGPQHGPALLGHPCHGGHQQFKVKAAPQGYQGVLF